MHNIIYIYYIYIKMAKTRDDKFKLAYDKANVEGIARTAELTGDDAKVTWNISTEISIAPITTMSGTCPEMGIAYGWFAPAGTIAPSESNISYIVNDYLNNKGSIPNVKAYLLVRVRVVVIPVSLAGTAGSVSLLSKGSVYTTTS